MFNVTAKYLYDSFTIHYSDNGTNNCTKEEEVLKFLSGLSHIPVTGFDNIPKVKFTDDQPDQNEG